MKMRRRGRRTPEPESGPRGRRLLLRRARPRDSGGRRRLLRRDGAERRRPGRLRTFASRYGEATLLLAVTATLYAVAWPTLHLTHQVPAPLQPVIAAAAAFPFLLVRAHPAAGWCVSAGAAVVVPLAFDPVPTAPGGPPWQVVHIIVLLALFVAVCLTQGQARVAGVWAGTVVLFAVFAPGSDGVGWAVGLTVILVFTVLLRRLWLSRRQLARQEELSRTERSRRAVLEERARIARDLHDVVAHHMSLVVVQAQTAQYRLGGLTPETTAEFDSLAGTAREALDEVRVMLGVLRSEVRSAERAPQPGVDRIGELVEGSRRAGIDVRYRESGATDRIRTATGVVLYRIAQESLANATRHAPGATVRVDLHAADGEVTLETVNGPPIAAQPEAAEYGGGNGIRGMRERAGAVGGTLTAGPGADGGFVVRAVLPVQAAAISERMGR